MKKRLLAGLMLSFGFLVATTIAWMAPCPHLPTTPVAVSHTLPGVNSFFDIRFSGIPVGAVSDVVNGMIYPGWCIEDNFQHNTPDPVTLFCTYNTALPGNLGTIAWDRVNYLLNHKIGDKWDVQAALWVLIWGSSPSLPVTQAASDMLAAATSPSAAGFTPKAGEVVAVIVYTGDGGLGPTGWQDTIIEILIPGGEGCTPGYWRNHLSDWATTGYSPSDDFDTVFGVNLFEPDITLGTAIRLGGGGVNKIARHGTAGLLSAAHPEVDYPYTVAQVIAIVQGGGINIDLLVGANEQGCNIPQN